MVRVIGIGAAALGALAVGAAGLRVVDELARLVWDMRTGRARHEAHEPRSGRWAGARRGDKGGASPTDPAPG